MCFSCKDLLKWTLEQKCPYCKGLFRHRSFCQQPNDQCTETPDYDGYVYRSMSREMQARFSCKLLVDPLGLSENDTVCNRTQAAKALDYYKDFAEGRVFFGENKLM